jgi:hypothetical protein
MADIYNSGANAYFQIEADNMAVVSILSSTSFPPNPVNATFPSEYFGKSNLEREVVPHWLIFPFFQRLRGIPANLIPFNFGFLPLTIVLVSLFLLGIMGSLWDMQEFQWNITA